MGYFRVAIVPGFNIDQGFLLDKKGAFTTINVPGATLRPMGSTLWAKSWEPSTIPRGYMVFWQLVDLGSASLARVWALDETLIVTR